MTTPKYRKFDTWEIMSYLNECISQVFFAQRILVRRTTPPTLACKVLNEVISEVEELIWNMSVSIKFS